MAKSQIKKEHKSEEELADLLREAIKQWQQADALLDEIVEGDVGTTTVDIRGVKMSMELDLFPEQVKDAMLKQLSDAANEQWVDRLGAIRRAAHQLYVRYNSRNDDGGPQDGDSEDDLLH